MNKHKLLIEYDFEFALLGISCHVKDYKLCWLLNKSIQVEFSQSDPIELAAGKKKVNYNVFMHDDEEMCTQFFIIANKSDGHYLVPEQKNIDYWLKVEGNYDENDVMELQKKIKPIPGVLTVFQLEVSKLKSKQNFIF
jgi:hypothetical protein